MSTMKILLMCFTFLLSPSLYAAGCSQSGQSLVDEGRSKQVKRICLTDSVRFNSFRSPDGHALVIADLKGFHLSIDGTNVEWPGKNDLVVRGAELAWSPTSSAFFINDGDGSGLDGWTLNVYRLSNGKVIYDNEINQQIVRRFRSEIGCAQQAADPNVRALGWSSDGARIFAFVQTTVNKSCGPQGDFRGVVARISGQSIQSFYTEDVTKKQFHGLLPYNMR